MLSKAGLSSKVNTFLFLRILNLIFRVNRKTGLKIMNDRANKRKTKEIRKQLEECCSKFTEDSSPKSIHLGNDFQEMLNTQDYNLMVNQLI